MLARHAAFITLVLSGINTSVSGQNLVPNPGFEQNIGLPNGLGQWPLALGWSNAGSLAANPDYYHLLGTGAGDLPITPASVVNPHGGQAVMGFLAYHKLQPNVRQYLTVQLNEPLVPGERYEASFYVTNGQLTEFSNAGLGIANLGILMSQTPAIQVGTGYIAQEPTSSLSSILYDRYWKRISFYFTASEAHEFLTLGLFRPDSEVMWETYEGGHPVLAYYFVDDFCVRQIQDWQHEMNQSITGEKGPKGSDLVDENSDLITGRPGAGDSFYIPNAFSPDGDGVNDDFRPVFKGNCEGYEFRIFDRWGHLVLMTDRKDRAWTGLINDKPAEPGVYVWQISFFAPGLGDAPESKIHRGSVQVLR
jgi:gliding motility-associated-like protein